jgi:hypothetical protein
MYHIPETKHRPPIAVVMSTGRSAARQHVPGRLLRNEFASDLITEIVRARQGDEWLTGHRIEGSRDDGIVFVLRSRIFN